MKALMKTAAAIAMLAFAAPAFAGGITVAEDGDSKLKLEALFYLNTYAQKADTTTAAGTASTKTQGLAVDRAYFTAKYSFNDNWMMRLTTDMGNEATLGKKQNIYLKYAYLEGKLLGKAAVLRLGQSHTPWIDYEQGLWKHRYVAKVMSDQYKFDDSSDLGIGVKGDIDMFHYWATYTNGTGYGNGARSNGMDMNFRFGVTPIEGLTVDVGYRNGTRGTKTFVGGVATSGVKSTLTEAMVTYGQKNFRAGVGYISNKDKADSATASVAHGGNTSSGFQTAVIGDEVKSTGQFLWAWGKFGDFGAFGRYETMKNKKTGVVTDEKVTHIVAGGEYYVTKGIDLALVADNTKLDNRGGVTANSRKDTRYGLYSQVKF